MRGHGPSPTSPPPSSRPNGDSVTEPPAAPEPAAASPEDPSAPHDQAPRVEAPQVEAPTRGTLSDALALLTLWTAGVSWPLLMELAADGPALVAREATTAKLLGLGVGVALLLPAGIAGLLHLSHTPGGAPLRVLRPALVCALLAAVLLHLANLSLPEGEGVSGDVLVVLSALLAGGLGAAYLRFEAVRRALAWGSPVALVVLGAFLLDRDVRGLLGGLDRAPAAAPVVMVVLDEVSMDSLLDEQDGIDRALLPHFAALADRGVLFRNASTVHEDPVAALAALLTGQRLGADGEPAEDLFTLLGSTHRPYVWGHLARLACPVPLLAGHGAPPGRLTRDASSAWARAVLPPPFDDVAAPAAGRWRPPGAGGPPIVTTPRPPSPTNGLDRVESFREFTAALSDDDGPLLAVIHSRLPARPWNHLPGDARYAITGEVDGLVEGQWSESAWPAARGEQRQLLQLLAADELLGDLLATLQKRELLERAVFVVTATGGASFAPGAHLAVPSLSSAPEVLSVPLIVAAPSLADRAGTASDRNVELFDVLPTLAELLARPVDPAWDGISLFSDTAPPPFKTADRVHGPAVVLSGEPPRDRPARDRRIDLFGRDVGRDGLWGLSPIPELVGRTVEQLAVSGLHRSTAQVHGVSGGEGELPLLLRGQVMANDVRDLPDVVVVAVNGRVVGATGTEPGTGPQASFGVLLPPHAFEGGGTQRIGLYATAPDGSLAVLDVVVWQLVEGEGGDVHQLVGSNGRVLTVRAGAFDAVLDAAEPVSDGVRLEGWSMDRLLKRPADSILVFVDDEFVRASATGMERADLVSAHGDDAMRYAGFDFVLPRELLAPDFMSRTRVFAVVDDLATELRSGKNARWLTHVTWHLEGRELVGTDGRRVTVGDANLWGTLEEARVEGDHLTLSGWAVDVGASAPVDELLVMVDGDSLISFAPGGQERLVASLLGGVEVADAGFSGSLPLSWCDGVPEGRIVMLAIRGDRASRLQSGPEAAWVAPGN